MRRDDACISNPNSWLDVQSTDVSPGGPTPHFGRVSGVVGRRSNDTIMHADRWPMNQSQSRPGSEVSEIESIQDPTQRHIKSTQSNRRSTLVSIRPVSID